ncbi:hypothetical protein L596_015206 [Steinernema carpocapsae]|uniref:MADF domain-containing protein n=1 Tax=Steinernema carpocapsae TaxID=34508 RepID=A0A4U5NF81_STECR|nr:hypothetical protein L596_015206 [Steinernema carpocapsae]
MDSEMDETHSDDGDRKGEPWKRALIEEVSYRPLLWNSKDPDFTKKYLKEGAWNEIALILNGDYGFNYQGSDIAALFKNLKDYFVRRRRLDSRVTASGREKPIKPWKFENCFDFLVGEEDEDSSDVPTPTRTMITRRSEFQQHQREEAQRHQREEAHKRSSLEPPKRRKVEEKDQVEAKISNILDQLQARVQKKEELVSSSPHFAKFVEASMKIVEGRNPVLAGQMKAELLAVCSRFEQLSLNQRLIE